MKRRLTIAMLCCATPLLTLSPLLVYAQPTQSEFVSYDNSPFGPGDRSMKVSVQLIGGETNSNTELWVIYGEDRTSIAAATLSGPAARGRIRLDTVTSEGVASGTFIFPHSDHDRPNMIDTNAVKISSGRTVHYKLIKKRGTQLSTSPLVTFSMPDKLTIANFGDSYASGEGAPYEQGADWDNDLCHRSSNSGQARAVNTIKREFREIAIAFKNVACSGAKVNEGIMLSQKKPTWFGEPEDLQTVVKPQLAAVRDWMGENGYAELNIAMVSGGGNDVNFGYFVEKYFVQPWEFRADTPEYNNLISTINYNVPQLYRNLHNAFEENFTYDRVLVSEYPDPTRDAQGQFCDPEHRAVHSAFLVPLNNAIKNTIDDLPKFSYVGGAMAESRRNGLCNRERPFFNDLGASLWEQADLYGIVHPNRRGHQEIFKPLYEVQLRDAVRDIQRKWALIKAKDTAREEARAAALMAQIKARTRIAQGWKSGQPLKGIQPVRIDAPFNFNAADKLATSKAIAAAKAANKPAQSLGIPDNRMADDDQ